VLRESDPQPSLWEALLPEQAKRLPAELAQVDAYLDERFIAPWRALFDRRLGRPSVPVESLLRLLYLKHRYQLGYESLCREVSDSTGWRRFCRIPLDRPVPHPTTLVKLVGRAGPEVVGQLNAALLDKLAADRLLRARKLRWTPPWWRPTSTTPRMRTCWSRRCGCASSAGWCAAPRHVAPPLAPRSAIVVVRPVGGSGSWPAHCAGGPGCAACRAPRPGSGWECSPTTCSG
jgi:IS5 family transposase